MYPEENSTTPSMSLQKQMCQSGLGNRLPLGLLHSHQGRVQTGSVLIIAAGCSRCLALACGR